MTLLTTSDDSRWCSLRHHLRNPVFPSPWVITYLGKYLLKYLYSFEGMLHNVSSFVLAEGHVSVAIFIQALSSHTPALLPSSLRIPNRLAPVSFLHYNFIVSVPGTPAQPQEEVDPLSDRHTGITQMEIATTNTRSWKQAAYHLGRSPIPHVHALNHRISPTNPRTAQNIQWHTWSQVSPEPSLVLSRDP